MNMFTNEPVHKLKHPEQVVQKNIVNYLTLKGFLFTAPDAGVNVPSVRTRSILKAMGRRAGVADLIIWIPGGTVCIECKKPNTYKLNTKTNRLVIDTIHGKQSEDQKIFEQKIKNIPGHYYFVATSLDDVIEFFKEHNFFNER